LTCGTIQLTNFSCAGLLLELDWQSTHGGRSGRAKQWGVVEAASVVDGGHGIEHDGDGHGLWRRHGSSRFRGNSRRHSGRHSGRHSHGASAQAAKVEAGASASTRARAGACSGSGARTCSGTRTCSAASDNVFDHIGLVSAVGEHRRDRTDRYLWLSRSLRH
jgi:hypothetical protein